MLKYGGFWLQENTGNNSFSFQERKPDSKLWVPLLQEAGLEKLSIGENIVFSEKNEEGKVENYIGLQNFLFFEYKNIPVYIFDNHNHAFAFWRREVFKGTIEKGIRLLHIDQHSDMRDNEFRLEEENREEIVTFTNTCCNVGNFIKPALACKLISEVEQLRTEQGLLCFQKPHQNYILDIDLDFRDKSMGIIHQQETLQKTKNLMQSAKIITIATSPYFLDQQQALKLIYQLFES